MCLAVVATLTGLEPATSAVTGRRANQLRHRALLTTAPRCRDARTPNGIRTRATAVKGRRPRPLDDGGQNRITPGYSQHGSLEPSQLRAPGTESSNEDPVSLCVAAPIAQLVELRTFNPQVLGSSPSGGTTSRQMQFDDFDEVTSDHVERIRRSAGKRNDDCAFDRRNGQRRQ